MFNSIALDVAIGLIFIYLLYGLLATTIGEAVATLLNLRGRIMLKSVERMLTDQFKFRDDASGWQNFKNIMLVVYYATFLRSGINYSRSLAQRFFNYPAIKYLSRGGLNKYPAYISCALFSSTLIEILRAKGTASTIMQEIIIGIDTPRLRKDPETKRYLHDLAAKANGDVNAFKTSLEVWFNETQDRATGWYKVKIQTLQFIIGLILAMAININTFDLVKILSKDEAARNGLVQMATDPKRLERYGQQIKDGDTTQNDVVYEKALKELSADSKEASKILGSGWHFEDSTKRCIGQTDVEKKWDFLKTIFQQPEVTPVPVPDAPTAKSDSSKVDEKKAKDFLDQTFALKPIEKEQLETLRKWTDTEFKKVDSIRFTVDTCSTVTGKDSTILATVYGQRLYHIHEKALFVIVETFTNSRNFFGFLITALALCLGAPFWFDLLNKFITIRGGGKNPDAKKEVAEDRSKETKFDSSKDRTNPQGHQLSEHMLSDPVRYALAINDQYLRSIPGVITLNRDFIIDHTNIKTPCVEVGVKPQCNRNLIPKKLEVTFEGINVNVPVVIREIESAKLHSADFKNKKLAIRNGFVREVGKEEWGTVTGLVRLKGKKGSSVLLSCSHVLRGDNRLNEVNATTNIHCCREGVTGEDPVVGKLLFQYQSRAFDVAWADFSSLMKADSTKAFVKDLVKIKQPREVNDDDAAVELPVSMDGAVSGPVRGVVWNSSVEFEFDSDIGFVKMFDLLKLTIPQEDGSFKTLSDCGDSGSLVSDLKGNPVGMVIGGNKKYTYALKLSEVFKRFDEIQYYQTV